MVVNNREALAVAQKLTDAVASLDKVRFAEVYCDDVIISHNFSNKTQNKAENVDFMGKIFSVVSEFSYKNITRLPTPVGFVQYHDLSGKFKDGSPTPIVRACIVASTRDGKISELNEWLDPAQFREVWNRIKHL